MFVVGKEVQGDVLVRCRHLQEDGSATTLFRFMFHTAFVHDGLLRLPKNDLDVTCANSSFPQDCWADVCFTEVAVCPWDFWKSFEHAKPQIHHRKREERPPSEPGTEEEEEEKLDSELLEKYRTALEESPSEGDDLSEYMNSLEERGHAVEP